MLIATEQNFNLYEVFDEKNKIGTISRKSYIDLFYGNWEYRDMNNNFIDSDVYRYDLCERHSIQLK